MTIALFLTLIAIFSTTTSLLTEAAKKVLDSKSVHYASNVVVVVIACVVGIGGTGAYYSITGIPFTAANITCMILMGVAVSVGSMVGYDKVTQAVAQIGKKS